ncbi:MAG: VanZ family protein [Gallionella sp.]
MLNHHRVWLTVGGVLVVVIIYVSLMHNPPAPLTFNNVDKLEHALSYALLTLWFGQIYHLTRTRVLLMVSLVGLGVALEYVQGWSGYRNFDVMDMLADGVGVLLGWGLLYTPLGRMLAYVDKKRAQDE